MSTTAIRVNGKAPATVTVTGVQVLPPTHWVDENPSLGKITEDIAGAMEARPGKGWWICFGIAFAALLNLGGMVSYLFAKGIGVWGLNNSDALRKQVSNHSA